MDASRSLLADVQLPSDGGEGQNIVVVVCHLVGGKLLVFLTDEIEAALVDQQIALKGWLLVKGCHSGFEAAVGSLDVAVAVVNPDDDGAIIDYIRPLAKLNKAVKIADAGNQSKAKSETISAITITF